MLIASDFDGTISRRDGLKMVLDHFVGSGWRHIEEAMKSGQMPERQGLRLAMEQLKAPEPEVMQFLLNELKLDPGFSSFVNWAHRSGHELVILSSGFQEFIEPILHREGIEGIEVWANNILWDGRSWIVSERSGPRICQSQSHCKCSSILKLSKKHEPVVFVGDGHSDRCAVKKADRVFAKAWLANFCDEQKIPFEAYSSFFDVRLALENPLAKIEIRNRAQH